MKKQNSDNEKDSDEETEDTVLIRDQTDSPTLEEQLMTLHNIVGINFSDDLDGNLTINFSLEAIKNLVTAEELDQQAKSLTAGLAIEIADVLVANNICLFLSMYLVVDQIERDRPSFTSIEQAMTFFEEQATLARKLVSKSITNPDEDEDPETADDLARNLQRFATFVRSTDYEKLHALYKAHNITLVNIAESLRNLSLSEMEREDLISENTAKLEIFLNELQVCFPDYCNGEAYSLTGTTINVLKDFLANLHPHTPCRSMIFSPDPTQSKKRKGPDPDPDHDSEKYKFQRLGM